MTERKNYSSREKDLRLAVRRIETGNAIVGTVKLSISSVAREAGVSAALIHNHYPSIAALIRSKADASGRQQPGAKLVPLEVERAKNADLRRELKAAQQDLCKLATINEMLRIENNALEAKSRTGRAWSSKRTTAEVPCRENGKRDE